MKLSNQELQEVIEYIKQGYTLCLPQNMPLKQYYQINRQIEKAMEAQKWAFLN